MNGQGQRDNRGRDRDRGKGRGRQGGGGGGQQARVYISEVKITKSKEKSGTFDIELTLGHTRQNDYNVSIPTRIFVQERYIAYTNVKLGTKETFTGIKLDLSKPIEVKIVKIGFPNEFDTLPVDTGKIEGFELPAHKERLDVKVLSPDNNGFHPVLFVTRDKEGKLGEGTVSVECNAELTIMDWERKTMAPCRFKTTDSGSLTLYIKPSARAVAVFVHEESGERKTRLLQKKEE
ncbi:MAG: hypothetical protein U1C57_01305 [Candidatus Doudnabacteria bacterium]|nr:hypothetical protein [bacterium]MDZ4243719.1 hypothetical protein [Candidatus Doudnabacteria bacterium]